MKHDATYVASPLMRLQQRGDGSLRAEAPTTARRIVVERPAIDLLMAFSYPHTAATAAAAIGGHDNAEAHVADWLEAGILVPASNPPSSLYRLEVFRQALAEWNAGKRKKPFPLCSPLPQQRPMIYYPGLDARELFDGERFEWAARLEAAAPTILAELDALLASRRGFHHVYPAYTDRGRWAAAYFYSFGHRDDANCAACPATAEILASIPGAVDYGTAKFSVLGPGAVVAPHCGTTNAKLKVQLPLRVPEGCALGVAGRTLEQVEGRCLIFNDSFFHNAWNHSDKSRVVLLFDVFHPDLTAEELDFLVEATFEKKRGRAYLDAVDTDDVPEWVYG